MKVKALVSFSGLVSMSAGEEKEINDSFIIDDLIKVGYIQEVKKKEGEN